MKITCPCCHTEITVNGLGRKKLDVPVKNIYDALARYSSITLAAESLGCSRGYIYKVLKDQKVNIHEISNVNGN